MTCPICKGPCKGTFNSDVINNLPVPVLSDAKNFERVKQAVLQADAQLVESDRQYRISKFPRSAEGA